MNAVQEAQLAQLDPTGERRALFDYRRSPRSVKVGDVLRVTFKNGDPFSGVCLSIRLRGIDTSFLLRNQLTRVGVEMSIKVFSPNVESVEIVQRAEKRKRRARLYYMRCVLISLCVCIKLDGKANEISFGFIGSPSTTWAASRTSLRTTSGRRDRLPARGAVARRRDGRLGQTLSAHGLDLGLFGANECVLLLAYVCILNFSPGFTFWADMDDS